MKFNGIEDTPLNENLNINSIGSYLDEIINCNMDSSKIEVILKRDLENEDQCVVYGRINSKKGLFTSEEIGRASCRERV